MESVMSRVGGMSWLRVAPLAGVWCALCTWLHFAWSGGVQLQEYPRSSALLVSSALAALGLCAAGAACVAVFRNVERLDLEAVLWAGLALHGSLLFALPLYSTDLFANLAYGQLAARGMDPRFFTPSDLGDSPLAGLTTWVTMKSVYGPVANFVTAIAGTVGEWANSPLWVGGACYKLVTGVLDAAGIVVLFRVARRAADATLRRGFALFALNPLLAWEVAGQGHNDGLVVAFATFYLVAEAKRRSWGSVIWLSLGTLSKFVLAPTLALYLFSWLRSAPRKAFALGALSLGIAAIFYAPSFLASPGLSAILPSLRTDDACSLYTGFSVFLRLLGAPTEAAVLAKTVFVWAGRALICVVMVALVWGVRSPRDVPRASLLLLLAITAGTVILMPWYLTWLLPFAAVVSDRRIQDVVLGMTVVAAPSLGVPGLWLLLPLCQLAALLALARYGELLAAFGRVPVREAGGALTREV